MQEGNGKTVLFPLASSY